MKQSSSENPQKPYVVCTARLPGDGEEKLDRSFAPLRLWDGSLTDDTVDELAPQVTMMVSTAFSKVSRDLLERFPNLGVISHFGVGYETVDVKAAADLGIPVTHTPDVLSDAVAEAAVGHAINLARGLAEADRFVREGKWLEGRFPLTAGLKGMRVGIAGLGRIGGEIASRLVPFRADISYWQRTRNPAAPFTYVDSLNELANWADMLIIALPGGAGTERIVDETVIHGVGPNGFIINIARGTIIDQPALLRALMDRRLGGAGLDVFADEPRVPKELTRMDNVFLTPHLGSATADTFEQMVDLVIGNLRAWRAGKPLLTPIPESADCVGA